MADQEPLQFDRQSQNAAMLELMLNGKRVSPLDALRIFGSLRAGARRWDLRKLGWNVQTEIVKENGKRFARYWIPLDKQRIEA